MKPRTVTGADDDRESDTRDPRAGGVGFVLRGRRIPWNRKIGDHTVDSNLGVTVQNVAVSYSGTQVLGPVTLELDRGGITALIGANGAGKSTLLRAVGRLIAPDSGVITVAGLDVHHTDTRQLAKVIAILQQENRVVARLTVEELVRFGRFPYSQGKLAAADQRGIDDALRFLSLTDLADRPLDSLSGGQRQRACIAMVLAQDTPYVLLDEPLAGLDMGHAVKLMQQIRSAVDSLGKSVLWVEHDVNVAAAFADRFVALVRGQVCASGSVSEVITAEVLQQVYDTPVEIVTHRGMRFAQNYFPD